MQILKMRSLEILRPNNTSYRNDAGKIIEATGYETPFSVRGSLQPLSNNDKKALNESSGVRIKEAYYFYTKSSDIKTIDDDVKEPDKTTISGREFEAWARSEWDGLMVTDHFVITFIRRDQVAKDDV